MVSKQSEQNSCARRRFIKAAGIAGVAGLAGCTGGGDGSDGSSGGDSDGSSGDGGSEDGDTGTTTGSAGSETTTLSFWTLFTGGDGEAMVELVEQFNEEHDDIQIERQRQPFDQYYEKLSTSMSGGNAPDLCVMHSSKQLRFAEGLVPLDDHVDAEPYVETTWDRVAPSGTHYGLPLGTFIWGLYYNKDIFEEAGLDPESPPTNYEELQSASNAIVENTDKLAFNPAPYGGPYNYAFISFLEQAGTSVLNEDKTAAGFDNADGQRAGQFLHDIAANGWDKADASGNRGNKAFRNGDLAMTMNGTWYQLVLSGLDMNWGHGKGFVMPDRKRKANWGDTHIVNVPKQGGMSDSEIEKRVTAAKWLTQQGTIWATTAGHVPTTKAVMESDELRNSPVWEKTLKNYVEMARDGQVAYWPVVENRSDYVRPLNKFGAQIYSNQIEPAEGVSMAAEQITTNLQS